MRKAYKMVSLAFCLMMAFIVWMPDRGFAASEDDLMDSVVSPIVVREDNQGDIVNVQSNDKNSRRVVNPVRYRKTNVRHYTSYSNWKRVSSDLTTGSGGGSISCNKEVEFSGSVSGKIKGISVSFGGSKKSKVGYTLHVGPNQTRHMVYRVRYAVESGTREVYDAITGKVISRNSYTAKTVVTGEYALSK